MSNAARQLFAKLRRLERSAFENRVSENIQLYERAIRELTVPGNADLAKMHSSLRFVTTSGEFIPVLQDPAGASFTISLSLIDLELFEDFMYGDINIGYVINTACRAKGVDVSLDVGTILPSTQSWNEYLNKVNYDGKDVVSTRLNTTIADALTKKQVVWCHDESCTGKTYAAIDTLEHYSEKKFVYNPCFSESCDYEMVKALLCVGENFSLLIDDIQCDSSKAEDIFACILRNMAEFEERRIRVVIVSWLSLLNGPLEMYEDIFPSCFADPDTCSAFLKSRIVSKELVAACSDNIALLNAAANIGNACEDDAESAIFRKLVKTDDEDKLSQIYRLCVLGMYEYAIPLSCANTGEISSSELSTYKRSGTHCYAGHREICRFITSHIEDMGISGLPLRQDVVYEFIMSTSNEEKWRAVRQLIGETGFDDLKAVSPIWNALHGFEKEIRHQTDKDPTWNNAPSSMYFVLKVASLLGVTDEYLNVVDSFCSKLVIEENKVSLMFDELTTTNDFLRIKERMIDEDGCTCEYNFEYERGDSIDCNRAHTNWCLGLFVGLRNELVVAGKKELYAAALKTLLDAQEEEGYWYPRRVPWVTARVLIGLCQAGFSVEDKRIARGVRFLVNALGDKQYWDSHTGNWNSIYETSALCLEAIHRSGYEIDKNIKGAVDYLYSHREEWMVEGGEVDGSATACCILKINGISEELLSYVNKLCSRCIFENIADNANLNLDAEQSCKTTQIAAYTTDFCWFVFKADLPKLLDQFVKRALMKPDEERSKRLKSIFISYSEDSEGFVRRLGKIARYLDGNGYKVFFYGNEPVGTNIVEFMQSATECDLILVAGTKGYKEKCTRIKEGGAFYENCVLSGMFMNEKRDRIVPIAFDEFEESFPPPLETNKGLRCKLVTKSFMKKLAKEIDKKLGGAR